MEKRSANKITLSIVSPAKALFEGEVDYVQIPTSEGLIGVLPHHAPLLGALGYGLLSLRKGKDVEKYVVDGGFVEINENEVVVLANSAETLKDVDLEQAKRDLEAAEKVEATTVLDRENKKNRILAAKVRIKYRTAG